MNLPLSASWSAHLRLQTLKSRIAAGLLLAMASSTLLVAWTMSEAMERGLVAQGHQRENLEARRAATLVDNRVHQLRAALSMVAAQLNRDTLDDPQELARFFEERPVLRTMFANVFAASADGRIRVLIDPAGARHPGTSIADRAYFQRLLDQKSPVVSDPVAGRFSSEPVIVFAHPLVDDGVVWGAIGGALRLASRDLMAQLAEPHSDDIDDTLVVVTDRQGLILAHPQRARLMQTVTDEPRLGAVFERWRAAGAPLEAEAARWPQAGEVVELAGVASTGWLVWRATRTEALLATVHGASVAASWRAVSMALVVTLLAILFMAWQLRPLTLLERRAERLLAGEGRDADWPHAGGEIGRLEAALRKVATDRALSEQARAEVLQRLSSVMLASPVGLAFTRNQRFELVSAECCRMLGRVEAEMLGQPTQLIFASNEDYLALGPQVGAAFAAHGAYGDEFALLLPGCPAERAREIAEQVRGAIAGLTLGWQGRTLRVGASLGLAARGPQHDTAASWMAEADAACYAAKAAGRDRVQMAPAAPKQPLRAV